MTTLDHELMRQTRSLFISAGHSQRDPGAYGNGYTEADVVLDFRNRVADAMRGKVAFGKDGDRGENLPLKDAVRLAKVRDVAVEFHCNAAGDPRATGVETLSGPEHIELGKALCRAVSDVMGIANRGAKGEASGQHSRLAFISDGGGIILELFFLTNRKDLREYLAAPQRVADAVARVLMEAVVDGPA